MGLTYTHAERTRHFLQGWKRETTHNIQEGSDWLRGYRCSDESGNEMRAHILNEVEVWRFHFKAIFPYLVISASAMHLRDATELSERASERGLVGVRDPALLPYSLPLAR